MNNSEAQFYKSYIKLAAKHLEYVSILFNMINEFFDNCESEIIVIRFYTMEHEIEELYKNIENKETFQLDIAIADINDKCSDTINLMKDFLKRKIN